MPRINFLEHMAKYVATVKEETLVRRRELVPELDDDYNIHSRAKRRETFARMKEKHPDYTYRAFGRDIAVYGYAFRFLNGNEEDRTKLRDRVLSGHAETEEIGIKYLIEAGISSWEEMMKAIGEHAGAGEDDDLKPGGSSAGNAVLSPFDFLAHSPSYQKRCGGEGKRSCLERRKLLLPFFGSGYSFFGREESARAKECYRAAGYQVKANSFYCDARVWTRAYQYLNSSGEEQARLAQEAMTRPNAADYLGVHCLVQDGIHTWDQILRLEQERQDKEKAEQALATDAAGSRTSAWPDIAQRKEERRYEIGQRFIKEERRAEDPPVDKPVAVPQEIMNRVNEAAGLLIGAFAEVVELLEQTRQEVAGLRQENDELQEQAISQSERIVRLERELAREDVQDLGKIADRYPHLPELLRLAERIRQEAAGANKTDAADETGLSQESKFYRVPIEYSEKFLEAFGKLTDAKKGQAVKQINFLSLFGGSYNSLETGPAPPSAEESKEGAQVSRASRDLRFTWKKNGDKLKVFGLYRHDELYPSERR